MNIYLISDIYECFYTAVFYGFKEDCVITSDKNVQLSLSDKIIKVSPERDKTERVKRKMSACDPHSVKFVNRVLRSDGKDKENAALDYIRALISFGRPIDGMFADPRVFKANSYAKKVGWEIDKMYGLLRFTECANGIFYAPYEPDCDITELIAPHFVARFKEEKFIIHDVKRGFAFLYNGKECMLAPLGKVEITLSEGEEGFKRLWQSYYKAVNIALRPHEKQMKGYMPVRYWKYLPEKN